MSRRLATVLLGGALVTLSGIVLSGGKETQPVAGPEQSGPLAWQRGLAVTSYNVEGYASADADLALSGVVATGSSHVAIVPTWYMETAESSSIGPEPDFTPSDSGVEEVIRGAKELGLKVVIKPHVDVMDGTFRGEIRPASRIAWFLDYRQMIRHYAEIAAQAEADGFVVGTELVSLSGEKDEWRRVIEVARDEFGGEIGYAANWIDEAEVINFWDRLDYIGIDAYMPLEAKSERPTTEDLIEAWRPYQRRIEALHERYALPVLFTELGYESVRGGFKRPFGGAAGPADGEAQARAYTAAFRTWARVPWFRGIFWWDWPVGESAATTGVGSYTPRGKPAADVLGRFNAELAMRR